MEYRNEILKARFKTYIKIGGTEDTQLDNEATQRFKYLPFG